MHTVNNITLGSSMNSAYNQNNGSIHNMDIVLSIKLLRGKRAEPKFWSGVNLNPNQSYTLRLEEAVFMNILNILSAFFGQLLNAPLLKENIRELVGMEKGVEGRGVPLENLLPSGNPGGTFTGSGEIRFRPKICIIRGPEPSHYTCEDGILILISLPLHIAGFITGIMGMMYHKANIPTHFAKPEQRTTSVYQRSKSYANEILPAPKNMYHDIINPRIQDCAASGSKPRGLAWPASSGPLGLRPDASLQPSLASIPPTQLYERLSFVLTFKFQDGMLLASFGYGQVGGHFSTLDSQASSMVFNQRSALRFVVLGLKLTLENGHLSLFVDLASILQNQEPRHTIEAATFAI